MSAQPFTVLIVEDEAALRRVLERTLAREGHRVLSAASAETAYDLLGSERADAALLDVRLPTMSDWRSISPSSTGPPRWSAAWRS